PGAVASRAVADVGTVALRALPQGRLVVTSYEVAHRRIHCCLHMHHDDGYESAYRPLLYVVSRMIAFPHGYTLLIFGTTMITSHRHGLPDVLSIFAMLVGACLSYIAVGAFAKRGNRRRKLRTIDTPFVSASANFVTLCAATGACAGTSLIPNDHLAWLVTGLTGTTVYMLGIAGRALWLHGKAPMA